MDSQSHFPFYHGVRRYECASHFRPRLKRAPRYSSGFRASRLSSTTPPGGHGKERCCLSGGVLLLRSHASAAEVHASAAETGAQHQSLVQTKPGSQCPGYEEPRRCGKSNSHEASRGCSARQCWVASFGGRHSPLLQWTHARMILVAAPRCPIGQDPVAGRHRQVLTPHGGSIPRIRAPRCLRLHLRITPVKRPHPALCQHLWRHSRPALVLATFGVSRTVLGAAPRLIGTPTLEFDSLSKAFARAQCH